MSGRRIGLFDTGVGGLSVLQRLAEFGAADEYIYFADRANRPYGGKAPETVFGLVKRAALFLLEQGITELVVACNTATAAAFDRLVPELSMPVRGPIEPAASRAAKLFPRGPIGVLASELTIASGQYERAIARTAPNSRVVSVPCPGLSSFVEAGQVTGSVLKSYLAEKLAVLKEFGVRLLVLGCTHYSFLLPLIRELMGDGTPLVDSSQELALVLSGEAACSPRAPVRKSIYCRYFVTADADQFAAVAGKLLAGSDDLVAPLTSVATVTW